MIRSVRLIGWGTFVLVVLFLAPLPSVICSDKITMIATTASDPIGAEYSFEFVSGGGHNSGWQPGSIYADTSLQPDTMYT